MLYYSNKLKSNSRVLRSNMTDSERRLWYHLRRKQLLDVQFFRQRPIGTSVMSFTYKGFHASTGWQPESDMKHPVVFTKKLPWRHTDENRYPEKTK